MPRGNTNWRQRHGPATHRRSGNGAALGTTFHQLAAEAAGWWVVPPPPTRVATPPHAATAVCARQCPPPPLPLPRPTAIAWCAVVPLLLAPRLACLTPTARTESPNHLHHRRFPSLPLRICSRLQAVGRPPRAPCCTRCRLSRRSSSRRFSFTVPLSSPPCQCFELRPPGV